MIVDKTGILLVPGKGGMDCPGNGAQGNECCCDECDYMMCCMERHDEIECAACGDSRCPRAGMA